MDHMLNIAVSYLILEVTRMSKRYHLQDVCMDWNNGPLMELCK
jgi:hypothetical protein